MNNYSGFIQILITIIVIAALLLTVVYYLNSTTSQLTPENQLIDDSSFEGASPKGIINKAQDKINNIEENKEKELQGYLDE